MSAMHSNTGPFMKQSDFLKLFWIRVHTGFSFATCVIFVFIYEVSKFNKWLSIKYQVGLDH